MKNSSDGPALAVVIPCFNCAAVLERCVASVLRSAEACPQVGAILLVDGGSADNTSEVCRALSTHPLVKVLAHDRSSASAKRNHALRNTRADYLVFTDPDCVATPGWLPAYALAAKEWRCCTGRVTPFRPGMETSVRTSPMDKTYRPGILYRAFAFRPGSSNNLMIERVLLEHLGGFPEDLGPGTPNGVAEDTEINYLVLRSGIPIRYLAVAEVRHDHPETVEQFLAKKESYARGLTYFLFHRYAKDPATYLSFAVMMAHTLLRALAGLLLFQRVSTRQAFRELRGRIQGLMLAARR